MAQRSGRGAAARTTGNEEIKLPAAPLDPAAILNAARRAVSAEINAATAVSKEINIKAHGSSVPISTAAEEGRSSGILDLNQLVTPAAAIMIGLRIAEAMKLSPEEQARIEAEKAKNRREIAAQREKAAQLSAELAQKIQLVRDGRDRYLQDVYQDEARLAEHRAKIERLAPYT